MRLMLCPPDNYLPDFFATYYIAQEILALPIGEVPIEMRGYDGFRAPSVTWIGQINREGGLRSRRFFANGNVWKDEYENDNVFFDTLPLQGIPPICHGYCHW